MDIKETLLSQYANSPNILAIINAASESIDPAKDINEFYDIAINVYTAKGFGLDILGRIVGVNRNISTPNPDEDYFGFFGSDDNPFDVAPFYDGSGVQSSYQMPDEPFRNLILAKAYVNIINPTAPNINKLMGTIFTNGRAYFLITGHMQATYVFEYRLSEFEKNLIYTKKLLPRPCGVEVLIKELPLSDYFGFAGTGLQPFSQAPFLK